PGRLPRRARLCGQSLPQPRSERGPNRAGARDAGQLAPRGGRATDGREQGRVEPRRPRGAEGRSRAHPPLVRRRVRPRRLAGRGRPVVLVGSGSEDIRSDFEAVLSNDVKERLVGWTHAEAHATPAELLHASEPMLEGVRDGTEERAVERWREEAGRNGRATSG